LINMPKSGMLTATMGRRHVQGESEQGGFN
jgi:hypothetical protein